MAKWNKAYYEVESTPKNEFSLFMATFRNALCRYCRLWSLFVSPQLKNRFSEAKRLCQRIKYRFAVYILLYIYMLYTKSLQGNGRNQVPILQK